jgi:hypothetical protein
MQVYLGTLGKKAVPPLLLVRLLFIVERQSGNIKKVVEGRLTFE